MEAEAEQTGLGGRCGAAGNHCLGLNLPVSVGSSAAVLSSVSPEDAAAEAEDLALCDQGLAPKPSGENMEQ